MGTCDFFDNQPFTFNVDACRAGGTAIEIYYLGTGTDEDILITNSTIASAAGLIYAKPMNEMDPPYTCFGNEKFMGWNNIFLGLDNYWDPHEPVALFYHDECSPLRLESDYSIAWNVRAHDDPDFVNPTYPGGHNSFEDPNFTGPLSGLEFGLIQSPQSPAVDTGNDEHCSTRDIRGEPRPGDGNEDGTVSCDMGAYELQ